MIERESPNFDARPAGTKIDILLLHYTGMQSAAAALERLCDPAAKVSAHYVIEEDGRTYRLVPEEMRAWHAGVSHWAGASDINARSIGIELVNPGHEFGYRAFPAAQMQALTALCRDILRRRPISPARVLGHSDVAPSRKEDPGELFDWRGLAAAGIGLWPDTPQTPDATPDIGDIQQMLHDFGYGIARSGVLDEESRKVLRAFQRHFRPSRLSGEADAECAGILRALLDLKSGET